MYTYNDFVSEINLIKTKYTEAHIFTVFHSYIYSERIRDK